MEIARTLIDHSDMVVTTRSSEGGNSLMDEHDTTILLVDDDGAVRKLLSRQLRSAGFQVIEARSGQDAFTLIDHHAGEIHLLLCDIAMPEVSGFEVAEHLKAARPNTKVLLMSGYHVEWSKIEEAGWPFIQKPFSKIELIEQIKLTLADARASSGY
jgi:CheY-like chemotaxis protein